MTRSVFHQVLHTDCSDPHSLLGAHSAEQDGRRGRIVRVHAPDVEHVSLVLKGHNGGAERHRAMERGPGGLFAVFVGEEEFDVDYLFEFHRHGATWRSADPYRFLPTWGDVDLHLFAEGKHYRLYEKLGAHPTEIDGVEGTCFAVWAPNARSVSVVGEFNQWDGRRHPMRRLNSGVWELFVPGVERGAIYKYEIKTREGHLRTKTDPFALWMEVRPANASVVWGLGDYRWGDGYWMERRRSLDHRREPMLVYEVHLGSWRRVPDEDNRWLTYRELAPQLIEHCRRHGFTHIELMPVAEHSYDPSWGYQTTGYYAPTSRFGEPDDLRYLIDLCHQNNIGVLLDWVPAHFPRDDWALRWFDGTALYEHADPRRGEHRDWGTLIFNYERPEVRLFLVANALYWLEQFHIDGLRVDAVASMLYRDYSRSAGDWVPNQYGGRENIEAITFLRELNTEVFGRFPGAFTVAEESTAWPGVTAPVHDHGLGFLFKWNMGWMHDTLTYLSREPIHRQYHQNELTFNALYTYTENFLLPLSHDEVVHGKGSLIDKMPGDPWQKAANLRVLLAYQYTTPGKVLLFMGGEFGQWREWQHDESLDWHLLEQPLNHGINQLVQALGRIYRMNDAFWAWDCDPSGFRWIDCSDAQNSVLSFARSGPSGHVVCVFNLTPVPRSDYRIGVPENRPYRIVLSTDAAAFGGSDYRLQDAIVTERLPMHGLAQSLSLNLPPLAALILEPSGPVVVDVEEESVAEKPNVL